VPDLERSLHGLSGVRSATPIKDRRQQPRPGTKVRHRHRVGAAVSDRVSELVYVKGRPFALPDWVDLGGVRAPLYVCELDPSKLHPRTNPPQLFDYAGLTADPRFPNAANEP
jgi:hypothetical protein